MHIHWKQASTATWSFPVDGCGHVPSTTTNTTNTSSCQCPVWLLIIYAWLPSSVGGFEVLDCWCLQISCVCVFMKEIILLRGHLSTTDIRKSVKQGSQLKSRYDTTSLKRQINMKSQHVSTTMSLSGLQQQTAQVKQWDDTVTFKCSQNRHTPIQGRQFVLTSWEDDFKMVLNGIRSSDVVRVNNYGLDMWACWSHMLCREQ